MISGQHSLRSSPERLLQAHPLDLGPYEDVYKHFHSHPEVSLHENDTASTIAKHPGLSAYTVHTSIGGCGLAGVLRNGNGPTVLLRADMDALFEEENTGLDYASKANMTDDADGQQKSVMHACGHDMHITCLLAAAEWLAKDEVRQEWAGTVIVVFQPNEERGEGAQAMVDDGLYKKVPIPDVVLAQHVMPLREGQVALKSGPAVAAADSFEVTLFGRGGHGSMPESCIDPVLLAANVIVRLQGIVSREISPSEVAVLTIGSLQAGQAENVIPDQALLKIDVRSENHATREKVLRAMRRIVEKECEASGCEEPPRFKQTRKFPLTVNDTDIAERLSQTFQKIFGDSFDPNAATAHASEDFSDLATSFDRPYYFWFIGGIDSGVWDQAKSDGRISQDIPANHSGLFAPVVKSTLQTGFTALCAAALTFLNTR